MCWMSTRRRRAREPEIHRRDEALAAGEHHRPGIGGEKRHRLADRLRCAVLEERRLHSLPFDAKQVHRAAGDDEAKGDARRFVRPAEGSCHDPIPLAKSSP